MGQDDQLDGRVQQRPRCESWRQWLGEQNEKRGLPVAFELDGDFRIRKVTAPPRPLADLLADKFAVRHINSAVAHYDDVVEKFQNNDWEAACAKAGKFVEAVLKALWVYVGETPPAGKLFKAGKIMDDLPKKSGEDSVRLTIPRACRLVYEISSNRGGRHDADEIDPNEMDATVAVEICSWILAEMLRIAQKGADPARVQELITGLTQKRYPFVEEVDGRIYVSLRGLSARDIALVVLWYVYPRRMEKKVLVETLRRHRMSPSNANVAVSRLAGVVDDDGSDRLRLLRIGLQEAENLTRGKGRAGR